MEKRDTFICDCLSLEHQYSFWYDEEDNQLYFEPHLYQGGNWFQRLKGRVKYLFGNKSRFGAWDETIINPDDALKIRDILDKIIEKDLNAIVERGRD